MSINITHNGAFINADLWGNVPHPHATEFVVTVDLQGEQLNSTSTHDLPKDVVLVVDVSGSMGSVVNEVRETCKAVGDVLGPQVRLNLRKIHLLKRTE
jgi:hypothetical protein